MSEKSMALSAAEQLAHFTVRIECDFPDGVGTGTGFFYAAQKTESTHVPLLITNKHVVEGATNGRISLTLYDANGDPDFAKIWPVTITDFNRGWVPHPDSDVDLCAWPVAEPIELILKQSGKRPYICFLDQSFLPTVAEIDDFVGMEEIVMIGYPNGLWDQVNNLPIFRRGILATHYKADWHGRKEFLIDAACFPGSSGSPVLIHDMNGYATRKGTNFGATRVRLMGILYAGPVQTTTGEVRVVTTPIKTKIIADTSIPMNLGIIIKGAQLEAFDKMQW